MANDIIGNLEEIGWRIENMGGGLRAMVKGRAVLTAMDGGLPYDDDWLICVYAEQDRLVWSTSCDDFETGILDEGLEALEHHADYPASLD